MRAVYATTLCGLHPTLKPSDHSDLCFSLWTNLNELSGQPTTIDLRAYYIPSTFPVLSPIFPTSQQGRHYFFLLCIIRELKPRQVKQPTQQSGKRGQGLEPGPLTPEPVLSQRKIWRMSYSRVMSPTVPVWSRAKKSRTSHDQFFKNTELKSFEFFSAKAFHLSPELPTINHTSCELIYQGQCSFAGHFLPSDPAELCHQPACFWSGTQKGRLSEHPCSPLES